MTKVDPITVEIIRSSLVMTAEQISARMIRAATAVIVKEMEDCSAALFDGQGRLLAESASIPIHLNCIGVCLRTIIDNYIPLNDWNEGDVILTNDPYAGPGSLSSHHTNDLIAYHPIFFDGNLVAISAINVHHLDVGAMWMATRGWNVEIEQEGLRIPPVKLVEKGALDQKVIAIILNNTRVPGGLENDLKSQLASITLASADIAALFERYGPATVNAAFEHLIDYAEQRTRNEISQIPDGKYHHEELILDDGAKGGPYKLCLKLTVKGSEIEFDFNGTDGQIKGPINAPLSATHASVFYVLRCITDHTIPNTEGCKRPVTIIAPKASLVNAQWPAASNQRMVVCHAIVDLVMGALASAVPERTMADSCGCSYNDTIGIDPATGDRVQFGEVVPGGIGATHQKDGANVLSCHVTNCPIPPIEATEIEAPALYLRREFIEDSGGAGKNRGGLGQVLEYQVLADSPQLHQTSQKSRIPPQGMAGGLPGTPGRWIINRGQADERELEFAIGEIIKLNPNDVVTQFTPGGGGYGKPHERSVDRVVADVENGVLSRDSALRDYGIRFADDNCEIVEILR